MRREFDLPEGDVGFLGQHNYEWETIGSPRSGWLLIHNYAIPNGYTHERVQVALHIQGAYPDTQIDMVYFYPALERTDGRTINALANQSIDGQVFQRWSRHRTRQNPWRPGVDDLSTHLALVDHWLQREFEIRSAA